MTNILDYDETKHWLNYITESPDRELTGIPSVSFAMENIVLTDKYLDDMERRPSVLDRLRKLYRRDRA